MDTHNKALDHLIENETRNLTRTANIMTAKEMECLDRAQYLAQRGLLTRSLSLLDQASEHQKTAAEFTERIEALRGTPGVSEKARRWAKKKKLDLLLDTNKT